MSSLVVQAIEGLVDVVNSSKSVLESLEWSQTDYLWSGKDDDSISISCCPVCGGISPNSNSTFNSKPRGHRKKCKMASVLAEIASLKEKGFCR